jgi:hypothetical protein
MAADVLACLGDVRELLDQGHVAGDLQLGFSALPIRTSIILFASHLLGSFGTNIKDLLHPCTDDPMLSIRPALAGQQFRLGLAVELAMLQAVRMEPCCLAGPLQMGVENIRNQHIP